jgi:hypothetical protein
MLKIMDYYSRVRYDQDYYDEPYSRSQAGDEDSYYEGYGGEPLYPGYRRGYYNEPSRRSDPGGYYNPPYSDYDYGLDEYGAPAREPYYRRGYEERRREAYFLGGHGRPAERGTYAGRGPRGYQRSDERISEDINDRLTDDAYVDATDIEVIVNDSVVTLKGRVGSREEKRRSEDIAESVSGVTDVSNQLRVNAPIKVDAERRAPQAWESEQ